MVRGELTVAWNDSTTSQVLGNKYLDTNRCKEYILQNQGQPEKCFGHFDSRDLPMEFICMDQCLTYFSHLLILKLKAIVR